MFGQMLQVELLRGAKFHASIRSSSSDALDMSLDFAEALTVCCLGLSHFTGFSVSV